MLNIVSSDKMGIFFIHFNGTAFLKGFLYEFFLTGSEQP